MNIFLYVLIGVVIGFVLGYWIKSAGGVGKPAEGNSDDLIREKEEEKAANIEKLKSFIATKDKITNDEVQNFLKVSDATAERYLDELEAEGLIKQVGKTGVKTYYERV